MRSLLFALLLGFQGIILSASIRCSIPMSCNRKPVWVDIDSNKQNFNDQVRAKFQKEVEDLTVKVQTLSKEVNELKAQTEKWESPTTTITELFATTASAEDTTGVTLNSYITLPVATTSVNDVTTMDIAVTRENDDSTSCGDIENKVEYEGKCFWAIIPGYDVAYLAAETLCREERAIPANIYSKAHFDEVMTYLRGLKNEFYYIYIGMEFNPDTRALSNNDGTPSTVDHWRSGDPITAVADAVRMSRVAIDIHPNPDNSGNGMVTSPLIWKKKGVLCEKSK